MIIFYNNDGNLNFNQWGPIRLNIFMLIANTEIGNIESYGVDKV